MIRNRNALPQGILTLAFLAAAFPSFGVEAGKAEGKVVYEGTAYEMKHAIAAERPDDFDPAERELVVILTSVPTGIEDIEDDELPSDPARFEVAFDKAGKARGIRLVKGFSEVGTGEGLQFQGTVDKPAKIVEGKVFTAGVVDLLGSPIEYSFTFKAPLHEVPSLAKPTAKERAEAAGSAQAKAWQAFVQAVRDGNGEAARKTAAKKLLDISETDKGAMMFMGWGLPEDPPQFVRLITQGDQSRLLMETQDEEGWARFAREGGEWKLVRYDFGPK